MKKRIIIACLALALIAWVALEVISAFDPNNRNKNAVVTIGDVYQVTFPSYQKAQPVPASFRGVPGGILVQTHQYRIVMYFRKATVFEFDPDTEWEPMSPEDKTAFILEWFDAQALHINPTVLQFTQEEIMGLSTYVLEYELDLDKTVFSIAYIGDGLFFCSKIDGKATDKQMYPYALSLLQTLEPISDSEAAPNGEPVSARLLNVL